MDPLFRVEVFTATPNPQTSCWLGMHQDYSEDFAFDEPRPSESKAGEILVRRLLMGERGHYGPLEHAHIVFSVGFFPHSVMQQARTHRIGVSFDVQSGRYTSKRIIDVTTGLRNLEEVFYVRLAGNYTNRTGKKYNYSDDARRLDLAHCRNAAFHYASQLDQGMAEEHARGILPFDIRQHFVVSFTLRALLHFLDLRAKLDAQDEIRQLCELMWPHLEAWTPEIAAWYKQSRLHRARLAP